MNLLRQLAQELLEIASNPKTPVLVATATTGSGLSTWLDLIPSNIGKLASLVGIVLSLILIRVQITLYNKHKLEVELLRRRLQQYDEAANDDRLHKPESQ